ncbi:MAG: 4Fe-4S binding protein [Desulfobacterales bacterium]|nr:MAG: 4Fe-4S binding protein [Desulfobacterales bacterium]
MFKMTPNVLRNLISKKATRRYPRQVRPPYESVRGELRNDSTQCNLCGACALKCPSQCITVDKTAGTWTCDPFACVYCGVCVDTCPAQSLTQKREYRPPAVERQTIFMQGEPRKKTKTPEAVESG